MPRRLGTDAGATVRAREGRTVRIMEKEERVSPGRWGGRSGPGETNAECSGFILGENRCVLVGVGQSGSQHIGETFDALGTSLECVRLIQLLPALKYVLSNQLLHAYWTKVFVVVFIQFFCSLLKFYMQ